MLVGHDASGQPITRSIEEVRVGDYVLAKAEGDAGDDVELRRVTEVFRYTKDHLRVLTFVTADGREQVIETTDEHPFYVDGRGWIGASGLLVGDRILQLDGGYATLASTLREEYASGVTVYNLTVEGDHTYFVDDEVAGGAVWVHNTCQRHHPIPKALGGLRKQVLHLVDKLHHAMFHRAVQAALDAARIPIRTLGGRGGINSAKKIADYFKENEGKQREVLNILIKTAKDYDAKHGTAFFKNLKHNLVRDNWNKHGW